MTERRPPLPDPQPPADVSDTPRDGSPAFGDTPREGTPAFGDTDEIQVSFDSDAPPLLAKDTVPPVGPSPDHASEYVPPRPLPKPADHKTMENIPVRVSPEADPRRAQTQKAMRVLEREEAQRQLMLLGVDGGAASVPPESRGSHPSLANAESKEKSRVGLVLGVVISLLILVTLVAIVVKSFGTEDAPAASTSATTPAAMVTAKPASTAARTATSPPATSAPAALPTSAPEVKPPIKRKKPAGEQGPKPINE